MTKKVLYLQYAKSESARRKLLAVQSLFAAQREDISLSVVETSDATISIRRVVKFWEPDGCIADCAGVKNAFRPNDFGNTPLVLLNRSADDKTDSTPSVLHDQRASALLAAKELIGLGRTSFAFIPWRHATNWTKERENVFREAVALHGHDVLTFKPRSADPMASRSELKTFLTELRKPAAVFAANDTMAQETLTAASVAGIAVPEDLAVASIDNHETIAPATNPPLTSVEVDFVEGGRLAAEMLSRLMGNPKTPVSNEFFGPLRIVRRRSTRISRVSDPEVSKALDIILRECSAGIRAADVAARFPCSRRSAEKRFRAATGHSIGDEILSRRMEIVYSLLKKPNVRLDAIAHLAGWKSPGVLRLYFTSLTGLSMREWRKREGIA